jgi:hypothetical protein
MFLGAMINTLAVYVSLLLFPRPTPAGAQQNDTCTCQTLVYQYSTLCLQASALPN